MQGDFEGFYRQNIGLIHMVCRRVYGARVVPLDLPVEYVDLEQEATITMMKCFQRFDESRGFKFSTYFCRAAYNDLNNFLEDFIKDKIELGQFSMSSTDADGEEVDLEDKIEGDFPSPERDMMARQFIEELRHKLSPLAHLILELTVSPDEQMEKEWLTKCELEKTTGEMTYGFINEYVQQLAGATQLDVKYARSEIANLRYELSKHE